MTDAELLRRYVAVRAEDVFAEFVRRHLGLVYFAALRRTGGNAALAEEVAQAVFTVAAREAGALARHAAVTGWLYTTTRHLAAKTMRAERTRQRLEHEAVLARELSANEGPADWERLRPVIDEALDELNARDRESVLLRFFEGQPFAAIGRAARISEDAARMRVERALGRLRAGLQRRGVTSTEAALGLLLAQQATGAVPVGLTATVAGAAVAGAAAAGVTVGAALIALMSTTQVAASLALAALLAFGFALRERRETTLADAALADSLHDLADIKARVRWKEQQAASLAPPAPLPSPASAARSPVITSREAEARVAGTALMERHPEVKEAFLRWNAGQVSAQYAPLFQALNLASAQIERFTELNRAHYALGFETSDDTGVLESLELKLPPVAMGPAFEGEIQALLGPEGFRAYQDYQRTGPARELTRRIGAALAWGDAPLTSEQAGQLVRIIDASGFEVPESPSRPPGEQGRRRERRVDWESVATQARAALSPPQLAAIALLEAEERYEQAWRETVNPSKSGALNH